jgi:hypothetical protein
MNALPDPEVILEIGAKARALLDDPAFQDVVNHLSDYHLAALVAAPPGPASADAREHHHLMHHALTQIVAEISSRVAAAEELARRIEEDIED